MTTTTSPVGDRPTEVLARWAADVYGAGVAHVEPTVRQLLIDHLANVFGGAEAPSTRAVVDLLRERPGSVPALGGLLTTEELSALLAGTSAHALEYDDTHQPSSSHPGSAVFPAALSVAAVEDRSYDQFAAAVVAGYEVAGRIGVAATASGQYERGFHPTGTSGVFGTTTAAGLLMGLDPDAIRSAMGIALSMASGSMAFLDDGAWTKRLHPGWAAHSGIFAARLAQRGFVGAVEPLVGRVNFLDSYSPTPDPPLLTDGLGSDPLVIERTSVKAHTCCRYMQAPIDAILGLVHAHDLQPDRVAKIRVGVLSAAWDIIVDPEVQKRSPHTVVDAQFSMPFGAAAALCRRGLSVTELTPEFIGSGPVRDVMQRVDCYRSEQLDRRFPAEWPAEVEIELDDGERLSASVDHAKGDPENPFTIDEMVDKFRTLAAGALASAQQDRVLDMIGRLGSDSTPAQLLSLVSESSATSLVVP